LIGTGRQEQKKITQAKTKQTPVVLLDADFVDGLELGYKARVSVGAIFVSHSVQFVVKG
jgi:hypothetical protein